MNKENLEFKNGWENINRIEVEREEFHISRRLKKIRYEKFKKLKGRSNMKV